MRDGDTEEETVEIKLRWRPAVNNLHVHRAAEVTAQVSAGNTEDEEDEEDEEEEVVGE